MAEKKMVRFPSYNVSLCEAIEIVKRDLDSPAFAYETKLLAIEKVANMETHNCITKDDLVGALRWIFEHYEFGEG